MDNKQSNIERKREFVKNYVSSEMKKGIKLQGVIYELSERLICDPRTVENYLYYKPKTQKTDHKY